jgi:hypothetical protein
MESGLERVNDDARLGGNVVVWLGAVVVGMALLGVGIYAAPDMAGFLAMVPGGVLAGLGYAELLSRMPTLTHRFWLSVVLGMVVLALIAGILAINASAAPGPTQNPDTLLMPYESSG